MFKRIDHTEIVASDLDRTLDFYTGILGFKLRERRLASLPPLKEVAYIVLGDTVLELLSCENPVPPLREGSQIGYRMVAIEVSDMDEATRYLNGKGIAVYGGQPKPGSTMRRAEIRDPDGLPIELRQW